MLESLVRSFGNVFFLRLMNRWVAGADAGSAVEYCRKLEAAGSSCQINFLGEHYHEPAQAREAVAEYKRLADAIKATELAGAAVTIKPSQFGFNAAGTKDPEAFCRKNMLEVVRYCASKGIITWLDMEDSATTDFTLDFYTRNFGEYPMGVCLQANLKRTDKDLLTLIARSSASVSSGKLGARVRLVKGIYSEKGRGAISGAADIHRNYLRLIRLAFEKSPASFGIAVGSHHEEAIRLALAMQKNHPKKFFELQVLKGILPAYYERLRKSGLRVVEYVPYGGDAFAYSVRRMVRNPRFARSVFFAVFYDTYRKLYGKLPQ